MLILSARPGESIFATLTEDMPKGTKIVVTVTGVKGNQCRLGFDAPLSIDVDRAEIYARKQAEKRGGNK